MNVMSHFDLEKYAVSVSLQRNEDHRLLLGSTYICEILSVALIGKVAIELLRDLL